MRKRRCEDAGATASSSTESKAAETDAELRARGHVSASRFGEASARPEFRSTGLRCAALDELARVTRFADVAAAIAALADDLPTPHGIVLAQAYPDQFSAAAIDRLRSLAPLARLIAILGSWCEGEPRSGHPLPGVIRIYWHQAAVRIRREFPRWFQPQGSAWRLPVTATDEERLLASIHTPLPKGQGLVAIWTRRPEMEGLLADACRRVGYATVWLHPRQPARVQGAAAAIYDGASLDAAGLAELAPVGRRRCSRAGGGLAGRSADPGRPSRPHARRRRAGQAVSC